MPTTESRIVISSAANCPVFNCSSILAITLCAGNRTPRFTVCACGLCLKPSQVRSTCASACSAAYLVLYPALPTQCFINRGNRNSAVAKFPPTSQSQISGINQKGPSELIMGSDIRSVAAVPKSSSCVKWISYVTNTSDSKARTRILPRFIGTRRFVFITSLNNPAVNSIS